MSVARGAFASWAGASERHHLVVVLEHARKDHHSAAVEVELDLIQRSELSGPEPPSNELDLLEARPCEGLPVAPGRAVCIEPPCPAPLLKEQDQSADTEGERSDECDANVVRAPDSGFDGLHRHFPRSSRTARIMRQGASDMCTRRSRRPCTGP